jgi:hypothetical protein
MAELTATDYAFLIILRAEDRELSNTEMDKRYEVRLIGPAFAKLNGNGFVDSDTTHRPYRHVITKKGLKELDGRLTIEVDDDGERRSVKEKVLWAALVARHNQDGAEPSRSEPIDLAGRIRAVYAQLAGAPGKWVNLTDLRPRLGDVSKTEVDMVLVGLLDSADVRLEPEPFGHRIGAAERAAAVHIGGEDRHKLAIGVR